MNFYFKGTIWDSYVVWGLASNLAKIFLQPESHVLALPMYASNQIGNLVIHPQHYRKIINYPTKNNFQLDEINLSIY